MSNWAFFVKVKNWSSSSILILTRKKLLFFGLTFFFFVDRLNKDISGGAWCPSKPMSYENSGQEWIQVNLTQRYVITSVATQGRFGNGLGLEFVEEYYLEYSRDGGLTWAKWKNSKGNHVSDYLFNPINH